MVIMALHDQKIVEVKGDGFHGVFASIERAHAWAKVRESGEPYDPIPQAGEA